MFFVWVVVAGLLQVTVLRDLNLLVVLAVFAGLKNGPLLGLLAGICIGAFSGVLSVSPFGLNLALYGLVGFLSGSAKEHIFYKESVLMQIIFSFCGLFLFYLAYFVLTNSMNVSILPTLLFSTIVSPAVFRVVEK